MLSFLIDFFLADENFPLAISLTLCSRQSLNAFSHFLCALLISFSFLVFPLTLTLYSCVLMLIRRPLPFPYTHTVISSLSFPSVSAPLMHSHLTPSVLSSRSLHPPFHQLKYGAGTGRTPASGLHQSVQSRAVPGAAAGKPAPTIKPPCWRSRLCFCQPASRGWSRARAGAARSSPSPCTCPTCRPS